MNKALDKPSGQSSTHEASSASYAVDGNIVTTLSDGCSQTEKEYNSWWYVDLESTTQVAYIKITNRGTDCCGETEPPSHFANPVITPTVFTVCCHCMRVTNQFSTSTIHIIPCQLLAYTCMSQIVFNQHPTPQITHQDLRASGLHAAV